MATKKPYIAQPVQTVDYDALMANLNGLPGASPEQASSRGLLRGAADLGLEAASGAAKGIKFMSDVFGADNPVSQGLQGVSDFAKELQSAQAKGEDQRIAQLMKEAEDKGIGEQVKAALRAAGEAPVRQAIGAIGTSVPMIAASMVPGLREASWGTRAAVLGGMGGAQGVGVVKSSMYDAVYQRAIEEGRGEQEARALAQQAQAYSPENAGDIALGGALGVGAALTGFEPAAARAVGGAAAKTAATKAAQRGLMQSTLRGTLAEMIPEGTQGFQEQVAGNRAEQRAGFDTPTFRGAAGSATLEGLLSAPGGAVGGMLDARGAKPAPKLLADQIRATESVPETGPMTRAANQAVEAKAQRVEMTAGAEGAALAAMEKQAQDDLQGLRDFAGRSSDVVAGMPVAGAQPAVPGAEPSAEFIDSPFLDRIQTVQEMLADPAIREKVRARWGDEGLNNIAYYAGMANRTGLPEKTQENLLGMAERLLSESVLTPIQPTPELGGVRRDPLTLGNQPQPATPALGMDNTPSGRFTVDPQGNVAPESRVQAMAAQRRAEEAASLGEQTPRGQAQPETTMQGALGIGMDTAPTGRLLAGQDGVRPETRMDAINIGQADMQRQAEAAQRAEVGLTPDIEAVQQRNAMRPQDGDILNPSGKPFKTLMAAQRAAKKKPGEIVEVTGGFAIRPATMVAAQPEVADDGRGDQAAAGLAEALTGSNPEAGNQAAAEPAAVAPGEMLDALPGQPAEAQPAQGDAGQGQRVDDRPAVDAGNQFEAANVQNLPQPAAAQAPADQAPEAARGDGAIPAGVPDQGGSAAAVEAAGVREAGKIAQAINASIAEHAIKGNRKHYAEQVAKGRMSQEDADKRAAADEQTLTSQSISERTQRLADAIAKKDPTALVGAWAREGQGTYGNEGSMLAFEKLTGIKLRRLNSTDRAKAIFDWAGWSEEQVAADVARRKQAKAESDAAYEAKRQAEFEERVTERAAKELVQFRDSGEKKPIKDYIDGLIAQGFNTIRTSKAGAITKTYLANEQGNGYPMPVGIMRDYAQAAVRRASQTPANQTSEMAPSRADLAARAPLPKGDPEQLAREQAEMDGINALVGVAPARDAQEAQPAATGTITADDVAAAEKQAAQMISDRIDAMTAQAAQKVAARFLPTMGVKVPVGKARIKAAMTDAAAMNLLGPAGELGIELSDSVKRALTAKMEGRVGDAAAPVAAAAPEPAQPEQQTADTQDDGKGWSSGFYGVAGTQKKYTFSSKPDGHWASVKNPVGQGYEIEYRLGDKVVSAEEVTGSLTAVKSQVSKRVAELDATQATHKDPGQPTEAATQPVIQAAMKKAARNEDTKPSEMRTWLLGEIDKALQQAPDLADYDATVKRVGEKDAVSMFTGGGLLGKNSETGYVTFDVPGDGTFKVRNSVRGLLEFKRKVEASPGFKDRGQDRVRPEEADSVRRGSGGLMSAITNMIEEGDFEAARDYAEAVGVKLEDVKAPKGTETRWKAFVKDGTLPAEAPAAQFPVSIDVESFEREFPEFKGYGITQITLKQNDIDFKSRDTIDNYVTLNKYTQRDFINAYTAGKLSKAADRQADATKAEVAPAPAASTFPYTSQQIASAYAQAESAIRGKAWSANADSTHKGRIRLRLKDMGMSEQDAQALLDRAATIQAGEMAGMKGAMMFLRLKDLQRAAIDRGLVAEPSADPAQQPATQERAAEAPADVPKLTQAEAAQLMEWQDMGQKNGVKTHALMFYESQANKDAKVGRMTIATVSKGDVSDKAWTVDGDDQKFGMLAQAKKRAMEIGMAKAIKDGFVEPAEGRAIADTRNDKPASDSLNKPHTIDKKRVLTPSGAIAAGARNSGADSSVWYHQGDIKMLAMTASVKVDGQLSKGADEAKRIVKAVSTAQKAGWALRNYRAGTLGTVWTLEKGDQFLTRAGLENIDAEQIKDPQIPDYGPGWDNMVRGQKDLAKALFSWLSTLPAEQRENQATVSRKMADVLGGWAYIERDKLGLHVRYKPSEKPEGNRVSGAQWTHTIPIATDWSHALQIIAEMAEGSFDAQPAAEAATNAATSTTPATDAHNAVMSAVREGKATPEQFKDGFEAVVTGKAAIMAELDTKTKVQLLREGGPYMQMRYASEKKADVVEAMYRQMLGEYALGESVTFGMGKDSYQNAVRRLVDATDADKLARFVQEQKAAEQEAKARIAAKAAAIQNPQTLEDYREVVRSKVREGMTTKEAFLSLTPEQRIRFDTLAAESTRDEREARKRAMKTRVSAASQTTGGQVIATKHTRDGYDLFVVQLADRLSAEDYKTVLASAKKLGGWYSSFRGNGATPGFQFKDRSSADAFLALAGGDKTAAQNQVEQRRDAFEDDRGQTAVERLRAMADKLEEQASEEEGRDRKANTARRARFASAALAAAAAEKAKANTMRNIAQAIEDGKAKFLDEVRTKSQVDMLTSIVETAKANELRAKYPSYADQEKRKGEPPTAETADFADFPSFSAFRSDLAILGRQLLEVDGAKKLGQRLMSVADDVTDAYLEFAKGNLSKVSHFGRGDALADFGNQQEAERAIKRSGLTGKAIVLQVKRGQNRVILSPSEAIGRGIWAGDGDKRITLTVEFGNELVEAIGRRGNKSNRLTVPWQFQNAYDRRKALSRIGIETASEFRSALREFIDLKEQATANRVRELELQMVGRQKDGLDFFPTAAEVADQMVEAADLSPDMAVLEPSAGMGHLADRIREAGAEPDVIELSPDRRELLEEKGYHLAEVDDFMAMEPRKFFTYGDVFRAPDGTEGIMRGVGHMGSQRVRLEDEAGNRLGLYDRSDLVGVRHRGTWSGYDRIIMNPPFSNRRDAEHVRHAYDLLKPGGRIVAIMGEGVFFGQDQKAVDFRDWLESVGGTSEKLPEGSFMDPSLPVNTSVNARMVVIDKPQLPGGEVQFSRAPRSPNGLTATETQSIADAIAERWANAPEIVVAADMNDAAIPQAVRDYDAQQRSLGAKGDPEGFWYDGKVYLVAKSMASPSDVMRVLFHESLGHYGLRGVFGDALDPILNQIAALRRADVQAKADEYGLSLNKPEERLQAAEEVLSVMAQTKPELGYVKRAIAAIRSWMRRTFPKLFGQMKLTDAEIIRDFILPARGWVEGGPGGGPKGGLPAMSRSQEQAAAEDAVRFSRAAAVRAYVAPAMDKLNETFNHPGKLSWWWKTIGSMYGLAERMPAFKPVYDAAQNFINDVSFYAIEAADKAPKLLPRLEDWRDLAKSPITAQDNKAVAAPVFEGTLSWRRDESGKPVLVEDLAKRYASLTPEQKAQRLLRAGAISENVLKMWQGMPQAQYESSVNTAFEGRMLKAGIVFTPDELKSIFKLNDAQVALYQEFRQSIDTSLDNMGKSDLLRVAGKDAADLKDAVMSASDVDAAAVLLRDHLLDLAKENPDRSDALVTTANDMITRAEKVQRLKLEGYAPLSRFGQYTVDVVVDGERQYFSMFETARDANRMAAKLKMEYGAENVAQGTLSQREFEMLQGITPESLELFGNMLGLDSTGNEAQDQVFQEYLKRTKANRSAMKRLIHRKGIAGYSEDVGRVLAAFVYSNARQTSAALHMGDLGEAVMAIPKGEGELKDAAVELARYVKEPREEAAKMRGWLFAQYLGGSIASAIVNFTQPLTTSAPYLSQFGGMGKSVKALYQAMADLKDKKFEAGLAESFRKRTEDGTLAPQGVHELMAQSRGEATLRTGDGTQVGDALAKGRNAVAKAMIGWGKLFGMAEQINRQSTYVAAYRMAVERGMADPDAFAKKVVDETQFVNNKANKMKFGRGAIGATLMTFKSYSLNWLELFHRLATQNGREGKMAAAWMVGVLLLSAGASGLPFAEDAEDLADFLAQRLGYNWSSKKARQQFLEDLFGRDIAGFVENGVTGLPGAPIDVSGRLGMGNMIPGTGLFLSKKDHTSDFTEVLGPAGDLAKRAFQAGDLLLSGNVGQAALMIAPKAIGNLEKGVDMAATGMYRDARGYKVDDATTGEAIGKAIGFQPRAVAQIQEASGLNQRAKDFYRLKVERINAKWAKAIFEKDAAAVDEVRAEIKEWNRQNPDQRIQANIPAILRRVKEMRKTKAERIADTAPKALRASMREEVRRMQEE